MISFYNVQLGVELIITPSYLYYQQLEDDQGRERGTFEEVEGYRQGTAREARQLSVLRC